MQRTAMTPPYEAVRPMAGARPPRLAFASHRWRLQTKLIASHAAVGAIVTVLSLLASYYVHRQADEQQARRVLVTSGVQALADGERGSLQTALSLLIGLFAMTVAVGLGAALARRLGRPLTALRDAAVAFGEGRMDHETVRAKGEIGEVASAFETMKARVLDNHRTMLTTEKMAAIGRLTAGIAHEMSSPLAAVIISIDELEGLVSEYAESIDDPGVLPADHRAINKQMADALEVTRMAAKRSADFVRSIRSQTRVASPAKQERFDPKTVVDDAANMVRSSARAARCTLSVDCTGTADLYGNPSMLGQAISNLLQNAIDATGDGGGGDVKVTVEADPDHVRIGVADTGPGILPEVLPRIFEALYTTKAYGRGTGLGLAIVKEAVEGGFGGRTEVATTVGKGTTFTLHLPRTKEASHGT